MTSRYRLIGMHSMFLFRSHFLDILTQWVIAFVELIGIADLEISPSSSTERGSKGMLQPYRNFCIAVNSDPEDVVAWGKLPMGFLSACRGRIV